MKQIINNKQSFPDTVEFCKKYFKNVRVIKNKGSELANRSQNYYTTILFENRGDTFSIKWNYHYCIIFFGDISKNKKISCQYNFTKIKLDACYPIEESNNFNVVFWEYEIIHPHDDMPQEISPLRLPVTVC